MNRSAGDDIAAAVADADADVDAAERDFEKAAVEDDVWKLYVHLEEAVVDGSDACILGSSLCLIGRRVRLRLVCPAARVRIERLRWQLRRLSPRIGRPCRHCLCLGMLHLRLK